MNEEQFERLEHQEARDGRFMIRATNVLSAGLAIGTGVAMFGSLGDLSATPMEPNFAMKLGYTILSSSAVAYFPVACWFTAREIYRDVRGLGEYRDQRRSEILNLEGEQ